MAGFSVHLESKQFEHLESKSFEVTGANLEAWLCDVMKTYLPSSHQPQKLASETIQAMRYKWQYAVQLTVQSPAARSFPTCLLVFDWAGYMQGFWTVQMVSVRHAMADVLTDAELQETVCMNMEDVKHTEFAKKGTFHVLPIAKPSGQRSSYLPRTAQRPTETSLSQRATTLDMPSKQVDERLWRRPQPPASITDSVKRASINNEKNLKDFLQTLVMNAFPVECRQPAYVENLVNASAATKIYGTEVSYAVKPSGTQYEVGRLSVAWMQASQSWDVIFLSLDNQGCPNITSSAVSAHFEAKIASLRRRKGVTMRQEQLTDF